VAEETDRGQLKASLEGRPMAPRVRRRKIQQSEMEEVEACLEQFVIVTWMVQIARRAT
jgi:hypothetical protein